MSIRNLASGVVVVWLSVAVDAQTCATSQLTFVPGGGSFNADSERPIVSRDGRFVAFVSYATNTGVATSYGQVLLLDRTSGAWELVSATPSGGSSTHAPGVSAQYTAALDISSDARFVLFISDAPDIVAGDTNTQPPQGLGLLAMDVFLRDRVTGVTITPNRMPDGTTGAGFASWGVMTPDAHWIAFTSTNPLTPNDQDVESDAFLYDRLTGVTTMVGLTSQGTSPTHPVGVNGISDDGRFVLLMTAASDMVPGDTNGVQDAFVRDLVTGAVERVSIGPGGIEGNRLSGGAGLTPDGRFAMFMTMSDNWPGQTFPVPTLYLRDRWLATTTLVSARFDGTPVLNAQGPYSLSADGRFALFSSPTAQIVPEDTNNKSDVFLRDIVAGVTTLVSATPAGPVSAAHSYSGDLSADGRTIVFASRSALLTNPNISNQVEDIFVRECEPNSPAVYCIASPTSIGCSPSISFSGAASASAGSGFDIVLASTVNQRAGLLFYSTNGSTLTVLAAQWLCVRSPVRRTAKSNSGGSPSGDDCSGAFHFDFNAHVASGLDPSLGAGSGVWAQYWTRESGANGSPHLSDALHFTIAP